MPPQTVVPLQPFQPELMMQRGELAKARRLLRKLDRLREQFDLDEALPKPARKDTSTHEAQKGNLGGKQRDRKSVV